MALYFLREFSSIYHIHHSVQSIQLLLSICLLYQIQNQDVHICIYLVFKNWPRFLLFWMQLHLFGINLALIRLPQLTFRVGWGSLISINCE